jgi:hypothetical protein
VDFAQENRPAQGDEDRLDQTRSELERLGRQLEQFSATCSARESLNIGGIIVREGCAPLSPFVKREVLRPLPPT